LLNSEEDALMVSYIMNIRIQRPDIFIVAEIVDTPNFHKSFEMAGANKIIDTGSL
jgi:hypothetical protein